MKAMTDALRADSQKEKDELKARTETVHPSG